MRLPLQECIAKHTYRQYLVALAWLNEQPDNQVRTEAYLRLIALRIQQVLAKNPGSITLNDQLIAFEKCEAIKKPVKEKDPEEETKTQAGIWKALVGWSKFHKKT